MAPDGPPDGPAYVPGWPSNQQLRDHYGHYGLTGNSFSLQRFRSAVVRLWEDMAGPPPTVWLPLLGRLLAGC